MILLIQNLNYFWNWSDCMLNPMSPETDHLWIWSLLRDPYFESFRGPWEEDLHSEIKYLHFWVLGLQVRQEEGDGMGLGEPGGGAAENGRMEGTAGILPE